MLWKGVFVQICAIDYVGPVAPRGWGDDMGAFGGTDSTGGGIEFGIPGGCASWGATRVHDRPSWDDLAGWGAVDAR